MKQFIYPALYYADDENETSTLLIDDLDIISSSDTVENAYLSAKDHLQNFVDWSIKYGGVINPATSFKETCALNPKRDVLLVDVNSDAVPVNRDDLNGDFGQVFNLLTE